MGMSRKREWSEMELRSLLARTVQETRAHPKRPDGTYNYCEEAILQKMLDEYYDPEHGWRSRLYDDADKQS
jgi:hypothetical protein